MATPLLSKIILQCKSTFNSPFPVTDHKKLKSIVDLVDRLQHKHFNNLTPPEYFGNSSGMKRKLSNPILFHNICKTNFFTMGVFVVPPGSSLPLHDHPGMTGIITTESFN